MPYRLRKLVPHLEFLPKKHYYAFCYKMKADLHYLDVSFAWVSCDLDIILSIDI